MPITKKELKEMLWKAIDELEEEGYEFLEPGEREFLEREGTIVDYFRKTLPTKEELFFEVWDSLRKTYEDFKYVRSKDIIYEAVKERAKMFYRHVNTLSNKEKRAIFDREVKEYEEYLKRVLDPGQI